MIWIDDSLVFRSIAIWKIESNCGSATAWPDRNKGTAPQFAVLRSPKAVQAKDENSLQVDEHWRKNLKRWYTHYNIWNCFEYFVRLINSITSKWWTTWKQASIIFSASAAFPSMTPKKLKTQGAPNRTNTANAPLTRIQNSLLRRLPPAFNIQAIKCVLST